MEGYTTQGFDSPQEALAALRPGEFDLLLTDLTDARRWTASP